MEKIMIIIDVIIQKVYIKIWFFIERGIFIDKYNTNKTNKCL